MTPDEDPFIEGIASDPADEALRLVYSDWLEEHGDDARAAYLRAEVAHFRTPYDARDYEWFDMPGVDPLWAGMVSRTKILIPGLTFSQTGPKVTRADVKAIEDQWGHPLPGDYVAFLLLYNGGSPSKPYLHSFLDDDDFYDEVYLFSTRDTDSVGRPVLLTNAADLLGGHYRDPQTAKDISRMIPIGPLTYSYDDGDEDQANLLGLILGPLDNPLDPRVVELTNSDRYGVHRDSDYVQGKESFDALLHSLEEGR